MTIEAATTFVYLGNVDERYPRDQQLSDCREAVKVFNLPAIGSSIYEHNELAKLITNLRGYELVLLPKLEVLAEFRGRGVSDRFLFNLIKVISGTYMVMDVHTGLKSHDGDTWIEHVKAARNTLTNSRPLSSEDAKKLNKASHNKKVKTKPGLVQHWENHVQVKDPDLFIRMGQHWRDPKHKNAKAAIDDSPDEELRGASRKTWERIFGNRTITNKS